MFAALLPLQVTREISLVRPCDGVALAGRARPVCRKKLSAYFPDWSLGMRGVFSSAFILRDGEGGHASRRLSLWPHFARFVGDPHIPETPARKRTAANVARWRSRARIRPALCPDDCFFPREFRRAIHG